MDGNDFCFPMKGWRQHLRHQQQEYITATQDQDLVQCILCLFPPPPTGNILLIHHFPTWSQ